MLASRQVKTYRCLTEAEGNMRRELEREPGRPIRWYSSGDDYHYLCPRTATAQIIQAKNR